MSTGPTTDTGITAAPVSISCALTNGERSIEVTPSLRPSASWRALIEASSFFRGQRLRFTSRIMFQNGDGPTDRDADGGPRGLHRRPPFLRARQAPGVAGEGSPPGGAPPPSPGEGGAAAPRAPPGHGALGADAAATGGHARPPHFLARAQHRARPPRPA